MERHSQPAADTPGILGVGQGAAGLAADIILSGSCMELHINAHTVVALLDHQCGGNGAVHAAAHGDQCLTHGK